MDRFDEVPEKMRGAVRMSLKNGVIPGEPCTLDISESVCAELIKNTFPEAAVGTRAHVTVIAKVNVSFYAVLGEDTIWFDDSGNAVIAESGAFPRAGYIVRVFDPNTKVKTVKSEDNPIGEAERVYVSGAIKDGTYFTGMAEKDIAMALSVDARTGNLMAPEDGVMFVSLGDTRISSKRDLRSIQPSDESKV